ncbi:50S ribosomal protein L16 [Candidatus Woesearchaeota archaeon]|nr:50S ribosomal protein L16 [Candidatus Woesearchaeota archaeon]
MAGLRKGICYRKLERPYTRKSKFKGKGYIKTIPNHKISRFEMGTKKEDYQYKVNLVSKSTLQIRQNSIESARMVVNRRLQKLLGADYFLMIHIFPHHALRENKMLGGAHADRLQTGMGQAFGKVINRAAQVKKGKILFSARVNKNALNSVKEAFRSAYPRLSCKCSIEIEEIKR